MKCVPWKLGRSPLRSQHAQFDMQNDLVFTVFKVCDLIVTLTKELDFKYL